MMLTELNCSTDADYSEGKAVILDSNDNIYISGDGFDYNGFEFNDALLTAKFDPNGDEVWAHLDAGNLEPQPNLAGGQAITLDGDQNVITGGYTPTQTPFYFNGANSNSGSLLWEITSGVASTFTSTVFGLFSNSTKDVFAVDNNAYYTVNGSSAIYDNLHDVTSTEFSPSGQSTWDKSFIGLPPHLNEEYGIASAYNPKIEALYVVGQEAKSESANQWFVVAYQTNH